MKAIVVGASSGIGKEIAITLSKNGFEVGIMARRIPLLKELKNHLTTKIYVEHIDLFNSSEAVIKAKNLIQKMGGVDLFIINSGTGFINPDLDWSKEKETIEVNVDGFCALAGEAYKTFSKQGHGHLVGISSIGALRGNPYAPAYNASKAFMSNYLEGLRIKAYKDKLPIVLTDIKPGFVDTDMAKGDGKFWVATPQKAAEQIYEAIRKRKSHAYITRRWKLFAWALQIMPEWLYKMF